MIPGIVASAAPIPFDPSFSTGIALPYTYRETDYNSLLTWTRTGAGPHITPDGFVGNGYNSRYVANTSLPSWITTSAGDLTIHAQIKPSRTMANTGAGSSRDVAIYVGTDNVTPVGKLELIVVEDIVSSRIPNVAARIDNSSITVKRLGRPFWSFEGQYPQLVSGGQPARPQSIHCLDAGHILVSAHYQEDHALVHKVRISDNELVGQFGFSSAYYHPGDFAERGDGTFWMINAGYLLEIDLEASLLSGNAVINTVYDLTVDPDGASGLEWLTFSGVEYLVFSEYKTSGTPYVYVVPATEVVNGGVFADSDRYKRFVIPFEVQGISYANGKLYTAQKEISGGSSQQGFIERFDLETAVASLADGSSLVAENVIWAPGKYVEGLDFHPVTGDIWTVTEGMGSVGDQNGWLSIWRGDTASTNRFNAYTLEYDHGTGVTTIKVNNRLFDTVTDSISTSPAAVCVGGLPQASAGVTAGFFTGTIKNIVIQDTPLTQQQYETAIGGYYEPDTLQVINVTLTNPGAESGTTGWTNETGALATRNAAPPPHTGGFSFGGGSNANTKARQRLTLTTALGLTTTEIDAGGLWGRVQWWQAGFSVADTDNGAMGLRFLDGSNVQQVENVAAKVRILPDYVADVANCWYFRGHPVTVPSGARSVDALMDMSRTTGTNLDCYIDDISLVFYRQ